MQRKRREVEAAIALVLLSLLRQMWRMIFPRIRDGRFDEISPAFAQWGEDFDREYTQAVTEGATVLAEAEAAWYRAAGKKVSFDTERIVAAFEDDTIANAGNGKRPAAMIISNMERGIWKDIRAWQADPARTQEQLQAKLQVWFSPARAAAIASTDTTNVLSIVTAEGMTQAGAGFWVWQTMEDERVCDECDQLHGSVFSLQSRTTPPKHHNCRCLMTPLVDWLRARDQPFQGIAEGLARR